jgi:hypothetical protein
MPSFTRRPPLNENLKLVLTILVATGWFVNLLAPIVVHSYHSSLTANAPLLLILGSLFQSSRKKKPDKKTPERYREDYLP